jgi:hypothetical protein
VSLEKRALHVRTGADRFVLPRAARIPMPPDEQRTGSCRRRQARVVVVHDSSDVTHRTVASCLDRTDRRTGVGEKRCDAFVMFLSYQTHANPGCAVSEAPRAAASLRALKGGYIVAAPSGLDRGGSSAVRSLGRCEAWGPDSVAQAFTCATHLSTVASGAGH